MGSRNSIPALSASWARVMLFSHELTQRSGTLVTAMPPEQFGEKKPSFSLLSLKIGDCLRPIEACLYSRFELDVDGTQRIYFHPKLYQGASVALARAGTDGC